MRWASVLTDAPLTATGQATDEKCGECHQCVDICPAGAFTGKSFQAGGNRNARFDARKCKTYLAEMNKKMGCSVLCGLCVAVCPHGKRWHGS